MVTKTQSHQYWEMGDREGNKKLNLAENEGEGVANAKNLLTL